MLPKILIVEDDLDIQELIVLSLKNKNLGSLMTANSLKDAKLQISDNDFDIILLDLNLNSEDGYELLKYINTFKTKIFIVSAKDSNLDVYKGFEEGAVDYIKKPFDPMELTYRVSAHIQDNRSNYYSDGRILINFDTAEIWINDHLINLTAREYDLLSFFIHNKNQILSKDQLYENVWGFETSVDDNTLMVHIRTLRKKIERDPQNPKVIKTVRSKGYIFKGDYNE
ncbi:response regulator transcription factor [Staphylococcus caeli]|uniref:DNA-binding response regulator n=1 Tax=Staphylococcus caeli TaxID=2201815 RepID=A0A1D4JWT5_9STAP|nr:response regulator transcription factor [Staphylococcus caeli]SCS66114.1 DNA-binding response regulator [Staphylococcus caeli]SCS86756.1 DNA-binding response regulator [Staphylococcus caeli]